MIVGCALKTTENLLHHTFIAQSINTLEINSKKCLVKIQLYNLSLTKET